LAKLINMTRGVPPVEVFPVEDLVQAGNAAWRRDPSILFQYGQAAGYPPLREWLAASHGAGVDQVMIGNSSLELFGFIVARLVGNGKRAFVEEPSYDRAITLLRRFGADVVGIPLQGDGIDVERLEAECKIGAPRLLYLICDFQNPAGITTSAEKRRRVGELARQYGFWVIEDAPYRRLRYTGEPVPTIRSFAPDRVLQMDSFSKTLSPGIRLGYGIGPAEMISELTAWAVDTYIGPVLPTQGMVYEYCRQGLLDANIEKLKVVYRPRLDAACDALQKYMPEAVWTRPEGGFFVGVTLPDGPNSNMGFLLQRAANAGIKLSDGRGYFTDPAAGDHFLRIPFCSLSESELDEGVRRLAELL